MRVKFTRGHAAGGKVKGNHTSLIPIAERVVRAADNLDCVSKISLGIIVMGKSTKFRRLKFAPTNGGLLVTVIGNKALQEVLVYTQDDLTTKNALNDAFKDSK